jgi:hypothetical protein
LLPLLLACLAAPTWPAEVKAVPLQNPGFEELSRGWSEELFKRFSSLVKVTPDAAHTGKYALRMSSDRGTENPYVAESVKDVEPGATYALRTWVRAEAGKPAGLSAVKIEFYNAAGQNTSGHYQRLLPPAAKSASAKPEWVPLEVVAQAGPDTTRASLLLRLFGAGTVWFDDVELVRVAPPPDLALTPVRQVVAPGKDRGFSLVVTLSRAWEGAEAPPFAVTLRVPPEGTPYRPEVQVQPLGPQQFALTAKVPDLASGSYRIECALKGLEGPAIAWLHAPLAKRQPANLRDDGTLLAAKKPLFPIGLYHVGTAD